LRCRTHPRRLLAGLTSAVLASMVALTGPAGSAGAVTHGVGLPIPATTVPRFAPVYMSYVDRHKPTASEAIAVAKTHDVIAASRNLAPYLADMRKANPELVVVGYVDAMFSRPSLGYPESWHVHDSRGHRVTTYQFGNDLMNPTNSEWRRTVAERCAAVLSATHYDGCFLDNLGQGSLSVGYVTASPVNPATGKAWAPAAWMTATSQLAASVQAAHPSAVMVANGLGRGAIFSGRDGTAPLLSTVAGAMSEIWLRTPTDPASHYRSEADWKADVDMLAAGGRVLVTPKLWVRATAAQAYAWHKYALASFLLGNSGRSFFTFTSSQTWGGLAGDSAMDRVDIGQPTGAYRQLSGAYVRTYSGGVVLVNPNNGVVDVPLPQGQYRDLDGRSISRSVRLNSHEGTVLDKY